MIHTQGGSVVYVYTKFQADDSFRSKDISRVTKFRNCILYVCTKFHSKMGDVLCQREIEGLRERAKYIDIVFSAHHSVVFCFRSSVYWWKGSVRF